jgi:uncharacterized protein (DUF362 family)
MQPIVSIPFESYAASVPKALDACGAGSVLAVQSRILLKPNLVMASPFPVTSHPECVAAVVDYVRSASGAEIIIAEGCGDAKRETPEIFAALGYVELAKRLDIPLLDLNTAPTKTFSRPECQIWPELVLPKCIEEWFILSLPVLKAHSLAGITGTLKNMMGFLPPAHYQGTCGTWKKNAFHTHMQQSILDLNAYLVPDLTLLDASVGLCSHHLGGPPCDPPIMEMISGFDPLAIDRSAAEHLGIKWQTIQHISKFKK